MYKALNTDVYVVLRWADSSTHNIGNITRGKSDIKSNFSTGSTSKANWSLFAADSGVELIWLQSELGREFNEERKVPYHFQMQKYVMIFPLRFQSINICDELFVRVQKLGLWYDERSISSRTGRPFSTFGKNRMMKKFSNYNGAEAKGKFN